MTSSELVYIYRVEDNDGAGMYQVYPSFTKLMYMFNEGIDCVNDDYEYLEEPNKDSHPVPNDDILCWKDLDFGLKEQHFFGFCSVKQLMNWTVNAQLRAFIESKYQSLMISIYSVPKEFVMYGGKQVAFIREKATLEERKPLTWADKAAKITESLQSARSSVG